MRLPSVKNVITTTCFLRLQAALLTSSRAVLCETHTESPATPPSSIEPLRILVLGGSGMVGSNFIRQSLLRGHEIVSVSRRGKPKNWQDISDSNAEPRWIACDLRNTSDFFQHMSQESKFDVYVHAVGVLFDSSSGLSALNPWISGSGSVSTNSSYDSVIRQSAFSMIDLAIQQHSAQSISSMPTVIFLSAAEAGWTFNPPIRWLQQYLNAKRSVEHRLYSLRESMRSIIFRPSLIWTRDHPLSLFTAFPFMLGNYLAERILGVSNLINAPVRLPNLVDAMLAAAEINSEVGIRKGKEIEELAERMKGRRLSTRVVVQRQTPRASENTAVKEPAGQCLQEEAANKPASRAA